VINLDQMGPESAKSFPGTRLVHVPAPAPCDPLGAAGTVGAEGRPPAERARQEIDYGRRGKGYIFGAFCPATGEALTRPYRGRTVANWVDFLEHVDAWLPAARSQVSAILDNLSVHRATDGLLCSLTPPRWAFVFQPTYAAYLHWIEPWWKILRSLALKGRRFEMWEEVCQAIAAATDYWNQHRHPFVWGQRRRHRVRRSSGGLSPLLAWRPSRRRCARQAGIAALPKIA
jgi:hypothetical protein